MKILLPILSVLLLTAFALAGCSPESKPSQPASPTTTKPIVEEPAGTVQVERTGVIPVETSPEVSTGQGGSTINLQTPIPVTDTPPSPDTGGQKTITRNDQGRTVIVKLGESFLLQLGDEYIWDINLSDPTIISRVKNIAVIRGAQGVYETLKAGTVTLSASGDPLCRQATPPCGMPSVLYQVNIVVQ